MGDCNITFKSGKDRIQELLIILRISEEKLKAQMYTFREMIPYANENVKKEITWNLNPEKGHRILYQVHAEQVANEKRVPNK